VGAAAKVRVVPAVTDGEDGLIETEASVGTGIDLMVMDAVASFVSPFKVALTNRVSVPTVESAVKVVGSEVELLRDPKTLLVRVQV
jgi:hypothetical protein